MDEAAGNPNLSLELVVAFLAPTSSRASQVNTSTPSAAASARNCATSESAIHFGDGQSRTLALVGPPEPALDLSGRTPFRAAYTGTRMGGGPSP